MGRSNEALTLPPIELSSIALSSLKAQFDSEASMAFNFPSWASYYVRIEELTWREVAAREETKYYECHVAIKKVT